MSVLEFIFPCTTIVHDCVHEYKIVNGPDAPEIPQADNVRRVEVSKRKGRAMSDH